MQILLLHGYKKMSSNIKTWDRITYLGCEWRYIGRESNGVRLKSSCKNVADIVVDFSREKYIKLGWY